MDPEQQDMIATFSSITGAAPERAEFYLRASEWGLEQAVATYYDSDGQNIPGEENPQGQVQVAPVASESQPETSTSSSQRSSRIQTFSSWNRKAPEGEDDDEEEGQAFYAGGSQESGQQILGPSKGKKKGPHIVENLFKAAKEHGAESVSNAEHNSSRNKPKSYFVGTGYRLGESESEPNRPVLGATKPREQVSVVLRLWKTGFTVDGGELRLYTDSNNSQFLQSITRGEIPQELVALAKGGEVALDMEDHRDEEYTPPKQPKVKAFTGEGQTLGTPTQASTSASVSRSTAQTVTVNPSEPTTNIQIRLSDGSRLVSKFNHSHTVGDVRSHIVASRPEYDSVSFTLMTNLPNRKLDNDSVTLKEADLLNAVIIQKI